MQYTLTGPAGSFDLDTVTRIIDEDPSALVEVDGRGGMLRVATVLTERELRVLAVDDPGVKLERHPSECCGGCGG